MKLRQFPEASVKEFLTRFSTFRTVLEIAADVVCLRSTKGTEDGEGLMPASTPSLHALHTFNNETEMAEGDSLSQAIPISREIASLDSSLDR